MAYIGNSAEFDATINKYEYTATASQTTFNATYDQRVDVYLNGVLLASSDYTATNGTSVILGTGAASGDIVQIDAYSNAGVTNLVSDATPQLGGDLDTNGNDISFGDSDKAIFGAGNDLQIYHDGTRSYISDQGTGDLRLRTNELRMVNAANNEIGIKAVEDGAVDLYYDGTSKLATTSTGVSVTGTVAATAFSGDGSALTGVGGGLSVVDQWQVTNAYSGINGTTITNWKQSDTYNMEGTSSGLSHSSGVFTFPETGIYLIQYTFQFYLESSSARYIGVHLAVTTDNSTYNDAQRSYESLNGGSSYYYLKLPGSIIFDVTSTTNCKFKFTLQTDNSSVNIDGGGTLTYSEFQVLKLADT